MGIPENHPAILKAYELGMVKEPSLYSDKKVDKASVTTHRQIVRADPSIVMSIRSEKEFQKWVVEMAKSNGWHLIYHTFNSKRSSPGFPDLILVRHFSRKPCMIAAELKVKKRKATPEQRAWLSAFKNAGIPAYEWRPADWEEIEKVLSEFE